MESELVKEIKELIDCDKKQNELGGIIVVNRQFLIEVIALINELKSENKRLKKQLEDMPIPFMECMLENQLLSDISKEKNGEIKALKDRIYELEYGIAKSMLGCEFLPECTDEKLKQFAERLKKRILSTPHILGGEGAIIDETLNEFLKGEKNE